MRRIVAFAFGWIVALGAAGCASSAGAVRAAAGVPARSSVLGRAIDGASIGLETIGDGPRAVLILASIHGDETAGTGLVRRLAVELVERPPPADVRVLLVPVLNPDGVARGTRTNARGVDLNRNFPAANFTAKEGRGDEPLSEPESRALHDLIERERPALIVSFHQPLACVDYDGPGAEIARAMAATGGLKVRRLGGRPGSLGSWAGATLGIPVVTIELPRAADLLDPEAAWKRYGEMLLNAAE